MGAVGALGVFGAIIMIVGIAFCLAVGIVEHDSKTGLNSEYLKGCGVLILILGFLMCIKELW